MSKPDVRAIVDLRIDFVLQNVSTKTLQCHWTDGWGPSSADPVGHEGLQDCLLDRYQLCAQNTDSPTYNKGWFDFTACLFANQIGTDIINDNMESFNKTVKHCSDVTGQDYEKLKACAESDQGRRFLQASHENEVKLNPKVGKSPDWIQVNGKDYGPDKKADWLKLICDAYTGSPKPKSCASTASEVVV